MNIAEPFKGRTDAELAEEMRRRQEDEKRRAKAEEAARTKEATGRAPTTVPLEATIAKLANQFKGGLSPAKQAEHQKRLDDAKLAAAQKKAATLWKDANVPEEHAELHEKETNTPRGKAWQAAFERLRAMRSNAQVALLGPQGRGKTQLAAELVREATARGQSAIWTTANKFLADVKSCYRDSAKTTELEVLARYSRADLLIIDEFHRRRGTEWEHGLLFEVLNNMYERRRRVILISNQTLAEFEAGVADDAIIGRINQYGGMMLCDWPSFRE